MKLIDLSLPLNDKTPVFPGVPPFKKEAIAKISKQGWGETQITLTSHFGTHIDAPSHIIPGGKTLSDYPLDYFYGRAIVIDVHNQLPITHIDEVFLKNVDFIFLYTGYKKSPKNPEYFEHLPCIDMEVAKKFADAKIKIVGIDTMSPDIEPYPIHKFLLGKGILILENLNNLDRIVGQKMTVVISFLSIEEVDGMPVRIIGLLEEC